MAVNIEDCIKELVAEYRKKTECCKWLGPSDCCNDCNWEHYCIVIKIWELEHPGEKKYVIYSPFDRRPAKH